MSYNTTLSLKDVQASRAQQKAYLVELEETVAALKSEVSSLTGKLEAAEQKAALAAQELTETKRENGQLADSARHLNNKIMTWEQLEQERSIQRLEQFAAVEAQSSAKDADIEKLQLAQKELQAELKKARALNPERLNRQNKDLKKRIAENKDANARLSEQLRQVKAELKELKVEQARTEKPLYRSEDGLFELRNLQSQATEKKAESEEQTPALTAVDCETGATLVAKGFNEVDEVEWVAPREVPADVSAQAADIIRKMMEDKTTA